MHVELANVRTVTTYVARSPETCFRVLTDPAQLPAWVPGLRKACVSATAPGGLPREILFEFSTSLTYSLLYSYDHAAREVRWEPQTGKRDAVRGFARFDALDTGTRLTYGLEQGTGRTAADLALGDPNALVIAFAHWVESTRPSAVKLSS